MTVFSLKTFCIISAIMLFVMASEAQAWFFGSNAEFRVRHIDVFPGHSLRFTIEKDDTDFDGTALIVACTTRAGNRIDLDPGVWNFTAESGTIGVSKRGAAFPGAPLIAIAIIVQSENSSYTAFELWEVQTRGPASSQVRAETADQAFTIFEVCDEALEVLDLGSR